MKIELNHNLSFDCVKQIIWINDTEKKLSIKETELFNLLAININNLTKQKDALDMIWSEDSNFAVKSMSVYINKLRNILKPLNDVNIVNIYGKGYILLIEK